MQWEYKVSSLWEEMIMQHRLKGRPMQGGSGLEAQQSMEEVLAGYGFDGWEMVSAAPFTSQDGVFNCFVFFKRPVPSIGASPGPALPLQADAPQG